MENQRVAELIRLMEASHLTALEVEQDGLRVRMEQPARHGEPAGAEGAPQPDPARGAPEPAPGTAPDGTPAAAPMVGADVHGVTAPMVGVFHALKSPVAMGDAVKKGQAVCIIEAMKLMNEIAAEHDGEVVWIAVREGDMVEYGQLLMQIREGTA